MPHPHGGCLPLAKRTSALASPDFLFIEAPNISPGVLSARPQHWRPGITCRDLDSLSFPLLVNVVNTCTSHFTCRIWAKPRVLEHGFSDPTSVDPLLCLCINGFYFNFKVCNYVAAALGLFVCQHVASAASDSPNSSSLLLSTVNDRSLGEHCDEGQESLLSNEALPL